MENGAPVLVLIICAVVAAALGFAACFLWMRSRETALKTAQAEALSAKAGELSREKVEREQELSACAARASELEQQLAVCAGQVAELEERLDAAQAELSRARIADELDRYSDFQLLGLCDVFDAEEAVGALRRPYGDPAMEQLMNLGMVDFEMPHDDGRDRTPHWTLTPDARAFTRACREQMDERTAAIRARRDAKRQQQ